MKSAYGIAVSLLFTILFLFSNILRAEEGLSEDVLTRANSPPFPADHHARWQSTGLRIFYS